MGSVSLNLILDKITSSDKDFRYMATSDLARELESTDLMLDDYNSKRVSDAVINQIYDSSGDISGLANKCLGILANKVDHNLLESMCGTLINRMKEDKDEQKRDAAFLGMKSIINELDVVHAANFAEYIGSKLTECMESEHDEIASNGFDLNVEFMSKHGAIYPDNTVIGNVIMPELERKRPGIRKKALQCLGILSPSLPTAYFDEQCGILIGKLKEFRAGGIVAEANTLMQAIAYIGRSAGYRLDKHISEIIPLALLVASSTEESDIEIIETSLIVLEICISKCPGPSKQFVAQISEQCAKCLTFDPNYDDDTDMDESDNDPLEETSEVSFEEEEAFSDDDDSSWRVRRASCKLASTIVTKYMDNLEDSYGIFHPVLLKKFNEREETVRFDVYQVYHDLLKAIADSDNLDVLTKFQDDSEKVLKRLVKMSRSSSVKSKIWIYKVLSQMNKVAPSTFVNSISRLVKDMKLSLEDSSSSSLQIEVLQFIESGFDAMKSSNSGAVCGPEIVSISENLFTCAKQRYFVLSSLALKCCKRLVRLIRGSPDDQISDEMSCLVLPLFSTVTDILSAQDKPQEVKNAAISCAGESVAVLGDLLDECRVGKLARDFAALPHDRTAKRPKIQGDNGVNMLPSLQEVVSLIVEKLNNETTRLSSIRALKTIIESPLKLDVSAPLGDAMTILKSFLKKYDRQLRVASLDTIAAIINCKGQELEVSELLQTAEEVSVLVSEDDMGVSNGSIDLLKDIVCSRSELTPKILDLVFNPLTNLLGSVTLQAATLEKAQALLSVIGKQNNIDSDMIAFNLISFGEGSQTNSTRIGTAQCAASLCHESGLTSKMISEVLRKLEGCDAKDNVKQFSFFLIKEIGRKGLIFDAESDRIMYVIMQAIQLPGNDEVADSAALALGGVAAGNSSDYMAKIIHYLYQEAEESSRTRYYMLKALNTALKIVCKRSDGIFEEKMARDIISALVSISVQEDMNEEKKAIIGECYGELALIAPDLVLPDFSNQLQSTDDNKMMALLGLKEAIVDRPHQIDTMLQNTLLPQALNLLADPDVHVRRASAQLLGTAAHSKPELVKHLLPEHLPNLFSQTRINPDLIRVINLGPFKHKVDDGLEQRKSAFDCIGILITKCWTAFPDHTQVANVVCDGLGDDYDVKLKCHDLVSLLCARAPGVMLSVLDRVVDPFTATLSARVKSDAVRQEVDRNEDMIRSCLRSVESLDRLEGSQDVGSFRSFMDTVVLGGNIKEKYEMIKKERKQVDNM